MKRLVTNYTFNAAAKTVTLPDFTSITLPQLLLITNVTDGIILYNFADPVLGATVATNVVTLEYDTTSMSNTDALQIYYDDAAQTPAIASEQIESRELLLAVYEALKVIAFLPALRDTANQLRVGVVSGSVGLATNQTLATLSNMTNIGGFSAQQQIPAAQNTAAVMSNINNVTIT